VLRSIFQITVQADLLIGADGINSVVRQGIIGDGFLTMQGECLGARSIFSRAIVSQRNNCNNVIQWSKFHADGCGDGYTFGVQVHYRQTIMSIDGQPMQTHVLKIFAGWAEPVGR